MLSSNVPQLWRLPPLTSSIFVEQSLWLNTSILQVTVDEVNLERSPEL